MRRGHPLTATLLLLACWAVTGATAHAQEPRTSAIPDAIVGRSPPPRGANVQYVAGDSRTTGYLAVPEGAGPFPALIIIHEWNGLVDRVRQVADAFADQGYVTLAADLYAGRTGSTREENAALAREARGNVPAAIANLDAAQQFLRARPDVTGKIGVMGWCFGGGIALSYGLGGAQHDATAIFYGSLIEDPEVLRALTHPVYGTFAANDRGIPPEQVERFAAALDAIGIENDIHVYDHVGHGFWLRVDDDPETRTAPAQHAWDRLMAFLRKALR
ncbi:MAG: dienelactone hydrolase family protein [Gemmatimonadota bacterium]|nr:dienelactone hydrolase family protein [Gemmatimonadota bacterium]